MLQMLAVEFEVHICLKYLCLP